MGLLHLVQESPYTHSLISSLISSPFLSLTCIVLFISIITRIITGVRSSIAQNNNDAASKTPNRIAYWLPWVGSALSFVRDIEGTISRDRDISGDGIFSYRIGAGKYYVVNMPSLVQQVFAQRGNVLNKQRTLEWFMKTAFNDKFSTRDEHEAFHGHHNALNLMLKEDFINEATSKTARAVEIEAGKLVTSAPWLYPDQEGKALELWEEAGKVKFNTDGTFEANFYALIVNYMGQIVIDMLWGKALIQNHPNLQQDMWDFDEGVHHIITKFLANVTAAGRRAVAARERLTIAMREWHLAVAAKQAGRLPGAQWGALEDISEVMQDRVKVWVSTHASETLQKTNDVSVLWGVNVNSNKNIFWMLMQIYTRSALLSDIREEIAPYVRVSPAGERGSDGYPKLSIDVDGLMKHCFLLKAAFYETMRMNMSGLGIREVLKDVVLKESPTDAALFGKKKAQAYTIPAGSTLVLANGTMQMDQRIFANPEQFYPERFIEEGPDGKPRVTMRNLHTFGGGLYKCKGRYFAEKEVMIFASSLLVMWDVESVNGEELKVPKMGYAGASRSPLEDVRVRLTRRYN
ncbi:cytochrome P450 [Setomelanomma holmii]|uniref:Cytochrome P450 n=1 Tax=Setomelanomma holmii TaxID=210430 RepID=A0A9P4H727_9PLEO|nr:cytochrome P450 [Setomelanomma holmii]